MRFQLIPVFIDGIIKAENKTVRRQCHKNSRDERMNGIGNRQSAIKLYFFLGETRIYVYHTVIYCYAHMFGNHTVCVWSIYSEFSTTRQSNWMLLTKQIHLIRTKTEFTTNTHEMLTLNERAAHWLHNAMKNKIENRHRARQRRTQRAIMTQFCFSSKSTKLRVCCIVCRWR